MKATLEFNLPEDSKELDMALKVNSYICILFDIDNYMRNKIKHGEDHLEAEILDKLRQKLYEIANDYNINLCE